MSPRAVIFDIQRFSIHDGPGIRTTVFFKGCPLRCPWCHNPESWLRTPQVLFYDKKCIACGACFKACPVEGALDPKSAQRVNRDLCNACGACTEACPAEALEMCGREMTVEEVLSEVEKDRPFYDNSGGGMTISGGEPLMQAEFALALLRAATQAKLSCVLDTSGYADRDAMREAGGLVDLVLFDLKIMDPRRHREVIGVDNAPIIENLRMLSGMGVPIAIRVPVIPGMTDDEENLRAIAALAASLPGIRRVDLMRYNRLGESKWKRLGRTYALEGTVSQKDDEMERLRSLVGACGLTANVQG